MGSSKQGMLAHSGATAAMQEFVKPIINNISKTVMGRLSAGSSSQGARPHTLP